MAKNFTKDISFSLRISRKYMYVANSFFPLALREYKSVLLNVNTISTIKVPLITLTYENRVSNFFNKVVSNQLITKNNPE